MVSLQHAHAVHKRALCGFFGGGGGAVERRDGFIESFNLIGVDLLRGRGRRHTLQLLQLLLL